MSYVNESMFPAVQCNVIQLHCEAQLFCYV